MLSERSIAEVTADLEREFKHCDYLKEYGGAILSMKMVWVST